MINMQQILRAVMAVAGLGAAVYAVTIWSAFFKAKATEAPPGPFTWKDVSIMMALLLGPPFLAIAFLRIAFEL